MLTHLKTWLPRVAFTLLIAGTSPVFANTAPFLTRLKQAQVRVVDISGKNLSPDQYKIERTWKGDLCNLSITNTGKEPVKLKNIILFELPEHQLDPATPVYGEGFQKLSQSVGTLGKLEWRGSYNEIGLYRIAEPDNIPTVYGMMTLEPNAGCHVLLGFTSCNRFIGRFSFNGKLLRISVDPEELELAPGESWKLEEFLATTGSDRNALLDRLAAEINRNHPPLAQPPLDKRTGWCTWYGVGGSGNQQIITEAAKFFGSKLPEIKFMQIDEGYTLEGDLLDVYPQFGDMKATVEAIHSSGLLPGIWVGPFIAAQKSHVLAEHPDWFVQWSDGKPMLSSTVGSGGWKNAPWSAVDGSNPEACKYLENVFSTLRTKYGFTYFKLDANYWGAIHKGIRFNPKATRIESYRRGMEAIIRGAGPDAIILGCNAPMWPSLGLVNVMRLSNDIKRTWARIAETAKENLLRGWQNGKLWVLDPDCVVLAGEYEAKKGVPGTTIPENVLYLHASVIHACGGLIMSGDKIPDLGPEQMAILRKLVPPTGKTARFDSIKLETGRTDLGKLQYLYAFNWETEPADRVLKLKQPSKLKDFWTGEELGIHQGQYEIKALPGRSARLLIAEAVEK